jgi:single-strand DNA-binding protein
MAGLPEITIAGTLVADPELRITPTGTSVANFTVAANDRRYDKDSGQWVDKGATFLRCSIWCHAADNVAESLTRGARVLLTGTLRQREWETPEGEKRYAFDVDVTEIGASLKWATVTVTKATRDTTTSSGNGNGGRDSWDDDKPPF